MRQEHDFDLKLGKEGKILLKPAKRKGMNRCMAVLLSVVLAAGGCLPAMAAEQTEILVEEAGSDASVESSQAVEENNADAVENESDPEAHSDDTEGQVTTTTDEGDDQGSATADEGDSQAAATADEGDDQVVTAADGGDDQTVEAAVDEASEDSVDANEQQDPSGASGASESGASGESGNPEELETSEWLQYFDYHIEGDRVVLTGGLNGVEIPVLNPFDVATSLETFTMPGSATVDGTLYTTVEVRPGITWRSY